MAALARSVEPNGDGRERVSPRRGSRNAGGVVTRRTLVWVAILVIVLVVVDILLVALALGRTAPAENGKPGPVPTFTSTPMAPENASPTPTPSATATGDATGQASAGRRLLSAVSASEAWRASGGECSGSKATLEHTIDAGATWTPITLGEDVGTVLALRAESNSVSVLVGIGDGCEPTVRTSADDGATWSAGTPGGAGAGFTNDNLVLSTGTVTSPCANPTDAFEGKFTTVVVCKDVVQWRSGTRAWVPVPVPGVRSIADDGNAYLIAEVGASGCKGVQIASLPAVNVTTATKTTPVGCAAGAGRDGSIVIARNSQSVWLWSGNDVLTSASGGTSW